MTNRLEKSLRKFGNDLSKDDLEISGELGATIGGIRTVEVTTRPSFVYVRLRNSTSELVQAFNDKVSPVYGLPVLVSYDGNKYKIVSRDVNRYRNWSSESSFLPKHATTHRFRRNKSGDTLWVDQEQYLPALIMPSGTYGANNVVIQPYSMKNLDGIWKYIGNTGTISLLPYRPISGSSLVLISIDTETGNPYYLVSSGTYIPETTTGTAYLLPYLPFSNSPKYIPDSFIRLVSGTQIISWDNIYDVRQFYNIPPTGTTGGSGLTQLTQDAYYYIRPDGNDSNDGLSGTSTRAWKTLDHALDYITSSIDGKGIYSVNVYLSSGSYTYNPSRAAYFLSDCAGSFEYITINGDSIHPEWVNVGNGFYIDSAVEWYLSGLSITTGSVSTGGQAIQGSNGYLFASDMDFRTAQYKTAGSLISAFGMGAHLNLWGAKITNNFAIDSLAYSDAGKVSIYGNLQFNQSPTPISYFAHAYGGEISFQNVTFTGSNYVSGSKFLIERDGNVVTASNDLSYLPGSTPGTLTQGRYDDRTTYYNQATGTISGPQGFADNYLISSSVASNNWTVALKTIANADASASDVIPIRIGNTQRDVTAALSVTVNAGASEFNLGSAELKNQDTDVFVYAVWKASTSSLGILLSRTPNARTVNDFSATSTNEKGYKCSLSGLATSDEVEIIGRANIQNSGSASYNWSLPATSIVISRPIYTTRVLVWAPQPSASGSMTWTSVTFSIASYILADTVWFAVKSSGTTGGTASNTLQFTLPWEARESANGPVYAGACVDTGLLQAGPGFINGGTPDFYGQRKSDSSNFGLGASRQVIITHIYQAN